jgi:hypothetical protein
MFTRLLGFIALLSVLACPVAYAQIPSESFDYPAGSSIAGLSGGTGFSGGWETGSQGTITSPGLTFGNLVTAGNAFNTAGSNNGAVRLFSGGTFGGDASTPIYVAFITAAAGAATPDYAGISLFNGTNEELFIGKPSGQTRYGIAQSGPAVVVPANTPGGTVADTPTFLVAEIIFAPGDDVVNLYVNPMPGQPLPSVPALTATRDDIRFDRIRIQSGGGAETFRFDEFRLCDTFAQVAPIPEPGAIALACAASSLLLRRRRA